MSTIIDTTVITFDLENPSPFIKKYIFKNNNIINKYTDLLFSDPNTTKSREWNSLPKLTKDLALELSIYKVQYGPNYYL